MIDSSADIQIYQNKLVPRILLQKSEPLTICRLLILNRRQMVSSAVNTFDNLKATWSKVLPEIEEFKKTV